jgi:hypothetical protein
MLFDDVYVRDGVPLASSQDVGSLSILEGQSVGITSLLSSHGGSSYSQGIYRVLDTSAIPRWTSVVEEAFPDLRRRILCFGVDWLGRMFALDFARRDRGECLVVMVEPGTGQVLEIPCGFLDFHNRELVQYQEEALARGFYEEWRNSGGHTPVYDECVGYKKPLFLNGSDTVDNLEVSDMDVYWTIVGQLLSKVRLLSGGARIANVRIKE